MQKTGEFCLRKFINPNFFTESGKTKKPIKNDGLSLLAETEGFEPSIQLPVYKLSRLARSTTLTSLRLFLEVKVRINNLILNYLNVLRSINNKNYSFNTFKLVLLFFPLPSSVLLSAIGTDCP